MIDATPSGLSANAYCDLAFAEAFNADQLYNQEWFKADEPSRESALITMTLYLDLFEFMGSPTVLGQALKFPATGIPYGGGYVDGTTIPEQIQQAVCIMALEYLRGDFAAKPAAQPLTSLKAGSFQIQFKSDDASVDFLSPLVERLIKPFRQTSLGYVRV